MAFYIFLKNLIFNIFFVKDLEPQRHDIRINYLHFSLHGVKTKYVFRHQHNVLKQKRIHAERCHNTRFLFLIL